ncbi:MAG: glutathione S-transferase family protein [Pseudomonadota bacterium]|nr:glutathione S-transferase family protein [Pseudomonadota bacterium]
MITLYGAGPMWGLPDPSPFVTKTETQLKMAGLAYTARFDGRARAPKGKIPFIEDNGELVADSTFIRRHIEKKYDFDFDEGLSPSKRAAAWALERMLEDHLYWAMLYFRWADYENFWAGPAAFFKGAPEEAVKQARESAVEKTRAHGIGRHSPEEVASLGCESLDALSELLGDGPYLFGDRPCGTDATAFAMTAGVLCPLFDSGLRDAAERLPNLKRYRDRMMKRYYPELV